MSTYSIYEGRVPVSSTASNNTLGARFYSRGDGVATAISFYKHAAQSNSIALKLWSDAGALLDSATRGGDGSSGWMTVALAGAVAIVKNTYYVVSAWFPSQSWYYTAGEAAGNSVTSSMIVASDGSRSGVGDVFPATPASNYHAVDLLMTSDLPLPTFDHHSTTTPCVIGFIKGICLGGMSNVFGDGRADTRHLALGIRKATDEGYPTPPCLAIDIPNMWRFRWGVLTGTRSISIYTKQVSSVTGLRPKMVVKANPSVGINVDVSASAGLGTGWIRIGPITINPTQDGALFVELWNMDIYNLNSPAYFDHLVAT